METSDKYFSDGGPRHQPGDYAGLTESERITVENWIKNHVRPRKSVNHDCNLYLIRAFQEMDTGLYLTKGQLKGAMLAAGHEPYDGHVMCWEFRITAFSSRENKWR